MVDITFNMERDSGRGAVEVKQRQRHTSGKVKFTNQDQFVVASFLFIGGMAGAIALAMYLMFQEGVFLY